MTTTTRFKGVTNLGLPLETDQLESNVASFFQWGALGVGAFSNVNISSVAPYGGRRDRLRLSSDPNFDNGQVWEGYRKDWVWERDVEYDYQPIAISGVYVNGDFVPSSATGAYEHHVDYPNGRVVFENPIPTGSVVTCEYSYRNIQVATADVPWFKLLQQNSFRVDEEFQSATDSGEWSVLPQNRMQLPALVIEATPHFSRRGKQIGGGEICTQEVLIHVLAENRTDMKKWVDICANQFQHRVSMFDCGAVAEANAYPLLADGSLASGAKMYPELVSSNADGGYFLRQLWFKDIRGVGSYESHGSLWFASVRATVEFDK